MRPEIKFCFVMEKKLLILYFITDEMKCSFVLAVDDVKWYIKNVNKQSAIKRQAFWREQCRHLLNKLYVKSNIN